MFPTEYQTIPRDINDIVSINSRVSLTVLTTSAILNSSMLNPLNYKLLYY
jgi:hypothetical protein